MSAAYSVGLVIQFDASLGFRLVPPPQALRWHPHSRVESQMRLRVDQTNDTLYFRLDEAAIFESEEVQPGVILDFNEQGQVIGLEILSVSARVKPEMLRTLQFETV